MIFNDSLLFIHIGKTGGMSCSHYLLHNLRPPVYNCHPCSILETKKILGKNIIPQQDIHRHCTLSEAIEYIHNLTGKTLMDFQRIVAVIRHPYTLEYSFYQHLRKPHVKQRRSNKCKRLVELANGDFVTFVKFAGYHRPKTPQDGFFRINDEIPSNVELVRFENLSRAFPAAVSSFLREDASHSFPHKNPSQYNRETQESFTDEVKNLIYLKHRYMFDSGLYER